MHGAFSCSLQHVNFDNELIASAVTAAVAAEAKVQKTVYAALANYFLNTPLRPTLIKRCSKYLSTDLFPASSFAQVDYFKVFNMLNQMGNQISVAVLKTLLGGWITARRTQSTSQPCLFCQAPESDSLQHYSICDTLWHAIATIFKPFKASFDPLELFGLLPACPFQLYGVYIAFHTYHALRHHSHASFDLTLSTAKAYTRGCKVHDHLIKSFSGKVRLKYISTPSPPLSTDSVSSSSNRNRSSPPSIEPATFAEQSNARALNRLRMPLNRQAVFRARGLPVGAQSL